MSKMQKLAQNEFLKLSKKEQKRLNGLKRIPTAPPSVVFSRKENRYKEHFEAWY